MVTLKEHFTKLLDEHDRRFELRLQATAGALVLARDEANRRFEELNQLRSEVTEDRGQFVTKESYDIRAASDTKMMQMLAERLTKIETRSVTWMAAIGIFFTLVQLAMLWYFNRK